MVPGEKLAWFICYNPAQSQPHSIRIVATHTPPPWSSFLAPRFWPTWTGIAFLCLCAWLPFRLRMSIGAVLGLATYRVARERRYITAINIRLCFPELSAEEQTALVRQSFVENARGLLETASGWVRPPAHFMTQLEMTGAEHLAAALGQGKGVLLLGAHYSTLDFGANLLSAHYPFAATYRPHKNPLFDAFMLRGRLRNCNGVFDRHDIRGAFKHLRQGKILWYAPDQDYGPEQSVFVPFFGIDAATITAGSRFATFNHSPVVLVRQGRDDTRSIYELEFYPLSPPFPTGDDLRDAQLVNHAVEKAIRVRPAQYLWMHKRFKTQRGGKPDSPYILIKTRDKKLSESQYAGLLEQSQPLQCGSNDTDYLQLLNGLALREFAGSARGINKQRHAALRLDRISKALRSCGIRTITTDNLFRIPSRKLTAITCFMPHGAPLDETWVPEEHAAAFLANLHDSGFHFATLSATNLLADQGAMAIIDPLQLCQVPGSASYSQRLADLLAWVRSSHGGQLEWPMLLQHYLPQVRRMEQQGFREWLARQPALADNAPTGGTAHMHQ
jgi:KDO2-lipid IV(A) lauroyltransferase